MFFISSILKMNDGAIWRLCRFRYFVSIRVVVDMISQMVDGSGSLAEGYGHRQATYMRWLHCLDVFPLSLHCV